MLTLKSVLTMKWIYFSGIQCCPPAG